MISIYQRENATFLIEAKNCENGRLYFLDIENLDSLIIGLDKMTNLQPIIKLVEIVND